MRSPVQSWASLLENQALTKLSWVLFWCPWTPREHQIYLFHLVFIISIGGCGVVWGEFLTSVPRRFWQFPYRHISISGSSHQVPGCYIAAWRDVQKRISFGGREHGGEHQHNLYIIKHYLYTTISHDIVISCPRLKDITLFQGST